jgi:hypothetical protein
MRTCGIMVFQKSHNRKQNSSYQTIDRGCTDRINKVYCQVNEKDNKNEREHRIRSGILLRIRVAGFGRPLARRRLARSAHDCGFFSYVLSLLRKPMIQVES